MNQLLKALFILFLFCVPSFAQWRQIAPAPAGKDSHTMAVNTKTGTVLLYGGSTSGFETWEWNGRGWTLKSTAGPGARSNAALAYDSQRDRFVLFGGRSESGVQFPNDTWEWDGNTWSKMSDRGPGGREQHAMAYDENRNVIVMFGGNSHTIDHPNLKRTWLWDGVKWKRQKTESPSARLDPLMTYDAGSSRIVLFGGRVDTTNLNDTWQLTENGWTKLNIAGPIPPWGQSIAYNPQRKHIFMTGGSASAKEDSLSIWIFKRNKWRKAISTEINRYANKLMVYDGAHGNTALFFGGRDNTLTFWKERNEWSKETIPWPVEPINGAAMSYDSKRDRTILFGGDFYNTTMEWDGRRWHEFERNPSTFPSKRFGTALVYAEDKEETVLFGGASLFLYEVSYYGDTLHWNGTRWHRHNLHASPSARYGHAMTYDASRKVVVLFGGYGYSSDGQSVAALRDTWEYDGKEWKKVSESGPPSRFTSALSYDKIRKRVTLFGGFIDGAAYGDTWEWDGTTWSQVSSSGPSPRYGHSLVYDDVKGTSILFGGVKQTHPGFEFYNDTWEWDGATWRKIKLVSRPNARDRFASAYDRKRSSIVVFGGRSGSGNNSDFWQFGPYRHINAAAADYDGDGSADPTVFNTATGEWKIYEGTAIRFGEGTDIPVPGDYKGKGKAQIAYYRPSNKSWKIKGVKIVTGLPTGIADYPVPGDYDGDGKDDIAFYKPATSSFYVHKQFERIVGQPGDMPVPADYDGDGTTDLAVWRPSSGRWIFETGKSVKFGKFDDIPVPADYNGDGKADLAVWRPSTGEWIVKRQGTVVLGIRGDVPVPADYNGNGKANITVYRPSTGEWFFIGRKNIILGGKDEIAVTY